MAAVGAVVLAVAVGCAGGGAAPAETGGGGADTGCEGTDCLPDACAPLDLCDNGIDDDCNGSVDEDGCSLGWVIGETEGKGLGFLLESDGADGSPWVYANQDPGEPLGHFGTAELAAPGELSATWNQDDEWVMRPSLRATSLMGEPVIAYGRGDNTDGGTAELIRPPLPGSGAEAELLSTWRLPVSTTERNGIYDLDLSAGESGTMMIASTPRDMAVLIDSPEVAGSEDMLADARAIFVPDDAETVGFGVGVGLLPDGAGDGMTLALVSAVDLAPESGTPGTLWAFDANESGIVGTDAATATLALGSYRGERPRSAGDLDGDGYPDLFVDIQSSRGLLHGPIAGDLVLEEIFWTSGVSLSSVGDIDGDGNLDLLATSVDMEGRPPPKVCLFYGPIPRERIEAPTDADACVDEPLAFTEAVAADITGDGVPEILAADQRFGVPGIPRAGIIAAFPLP